MQRADSIGGLSVLHAIILGIVQGLSEFLPISSSGHLILVPQLLGWNDLAADNSLNKSFDVALHAGTLVAALWYFRRDVWSYVRAAWDSVRARSVTTVEQRMAWLLLLSAIPGAVVGALFASVIEDKLGDPILIGINLILFGLLLDWSDRLAGKRFSDNFRRKDAAIMGIAQALALAPGTSRSGITITAGRFLRFSREGAARLSFLMAIPITGGAVLYKGVELFGDGGIPPGYGGAFLWGTIAAAVSGFVAIAVLLKYVRTHSFLPFVIYRVALGVIVIVVFATGLR
ncbi:MAG: undecaprenyl-diphosphate phosphatase [Acidimicrobiia bacterium]